MAKNSVLTHHETSRLNYLQIPNDFTLQDMEAAHILVEMFNRKENKRHRQDSINSEEQSSQSTSSGEAHLYFVPGSESTNSDEEFKEEKMKEIIGKKQKAVVSKKSHKYGIRSPRPMNAYMLFSKKNRPIVNKCLAYKDLAKGSRILGGWWRTLNDAHKKSYIALSNRIHEKHNKMYDLFEWTDTDDTYLRKAEEDRFVKQVLEAVNFDTLFKRLPFYKSTK